MTNSVDSDQTAPAPIGAVCSGSTMLASILNSSVMLGNYNLFAAEDFSRRHFQMHFFLGPLRVNYLKFQTLVPAKKQPHADFQSGGTFPDLRKVGKFFKFCRYS